LHAPLVALGLAPLVAWWHHRNGWAPKQSRRLTPRWERPCRSGSSQLRAIVAKRLECVRGGRTDAEFACLVADVAQTALRFEEIDARERAAKTPLPGSLPRYDDPSARAS